MIRVSVTRLVGVALIAGLISGVGLGLFHLGVSEPIVERAVALEGGGGTGGVEVFSRETQRAGLVGGAVAYGVALGLIFGGVFAYLRGLFSNRSTTASIAILAVLAAWVLALAPAIKYPADPPGVGDPSTVYSRQGAYLGFVVFNVLGLVGAGLGWRKLLASPLPAWLATLLAIAAYGAFVVLLMVLIPASDSKSAVPSSLLWQFRAASVGGQVLFWSVLGTTFAVLLRRKASHLPA